jgi:protein TonB
VSEKFHRPRDRRGLFYFSSNTASRIFAVSISASTNFTLEDTMFADSMLETSWTHRGRRSWTTLTSFGLQAAALALLLAIPLFRSVGLPAGQVLRTPVSWGANSPAPQPLPRQHVTTLTQSNYLGHILMEPTRIPTMVARVEENVAPPPFGYNTGSGGDVGGGSRDGVPGMPSEAAGPALPRLAPPPTAGPTFRTSQMLQGSLIRRVDPLYPPLARTAHIQGAVILEAVIGKDGTMENLRLISGHPMLTQAAIQAVSQWRYRPYILNGEAIEVETQITVNFILGGN